MGYKNLGEFIARLEKEGELFRIRDTVSPLLEITEITDRMSKSAGGGKALFFEKVAGSAFPVVTNAFGSYRRIALAFESTPQELAARLAGIIKQAPPKSMLAKIGMIPKALSWAKFIPRTKKLKVPPCQEVVLTGDEIDLTKLPILQCWPKDGGRFITLPVVFTKGLGDGRRNVGMYRMQMYDGKTTGMHWHIHKDGSHQFLEYQKAGRRMEVAVAVGTDPAVTYAATAPLPRGVDEMMLAGFIRRSPVVLVKGVTVDIDVPAEAEFILEGYVDPAETRLEGPFGDHTGYYSAADLYPVFHLTAITHRKNPVYSATVVGRPPMEDCYLAYTTERLFLPLLQTVMPEIKDYLLPWEGVFHSIAVVAIEKEYPGHAAKIAYGLWGSGQMSFAKALVIIDDQSLLADGRRLFEHILNIIDFSSDVTIASGILDVLDHSADNPLLGAKIAIDATVRIAGEGERLTECLDFSSISPEGDADLLLRLQEKEGGFTGLRVFFPGCKRRLIAATIDKEKGQSSRSYLDLLAREFRGGEIFVLYDAAIDLADDSLLLWKAFNNVDPARDITIAETNITIDATQKGPVDGHKRPWPDDIEMTPEIKRRVDIQ
ncbi:MAG: menaquinone biosynthesis decarboxylase [Syntrophales bacterium]|jgi:4-hydroxy-3-polyprenylbenzoate decarboxylase|nr:menaquinone biosynthesis decarboxylase [Syntrophales bacterium]